MKIYHNQCYLFTPRDNTKIENIEDLQNVVEGKKCNKCTNEIEHAQVIALRKFYRCISCREGYILPITDKEGAQNALQLYTSKQMSALLTIESKDGTFPLLSLNHHLSLVADMFPWKV